MRPRSSLIAAFLVIGGVAVVSTIAAISGGESTGGERGCADSLECGHHELCVDRQCVSFNEIPAPPRAALGQRCSFGTPCEEPNECYRDRCVKPYAALGEACSRDYPRRSCEGGLRCHNNECFRIAQEGEACEESFLCGRELECFDNKCLTEEGVRLAKERAMLEASGVTEASAERETERHPGQAVRIAEVSSNEGWAIASCRSNERLIGGGCDGGAMKTNRPDDFAKTDSVGARWRCESSSAKSIRAYALCQALPDKAGR